MKKFFIIAACLVLVFGVYLSMNTVDQQADTAVAAHPQYTGTVYVAGMGGHFSAAEVVITPADAANPIKVTNLKDVNDRIVIGGKDTHPTHDPRIDEKDTDIMYWSTYKIDKATGKKAVHVGKSNLKTGKVLVDNVVELDKRATWTGAIFCASGQTDKYYMPVTMTDEAYIDVYDKKKVELKHRVFLDQYKPGETKFYHGTNSPDGKYFALAVNRADNGTPNGNIDMLLLDLKSLEKGKAKVVKSSKLTGAPGKTLTFRQDFTPDGKYILQSGADRFYLLDAKTLDLVDEEMMTDGAQNHDAISTPDGKYAILTVRKGVSTVDSPEGKSVTDGMLMLYDIAAKTTIGEPVSVCYACHKNVGLGGNAILCGADANLK